MDVQVWQYVQKLRKICKQENGIYIFVRKSQLWVYKLGAGIMLNAL